MPTTHVLSFLERRETRILALAKDNQGRSAIDYALRVLRPDVCSALLDLGSVADADASEGGMTPLHFIAAQCFEDTLIRYERPGATNYTHTAETTPDHFLKSLQLWHRFIDAGLAVDSPDKAGDPPLFHYLRRSEPFVNPRARKAGETAITRPSPVPGSRPKPIVHFEELFGNADLKARNARGETALHIVANYPPRLHDVAMFKFLVDKGLDPLAEDNIGRSSLDVASETAKNGILDIFRNKT